jgi:hypothetical protein
VDPADAIAWKLHRVHSFLDYIMGGCQIHCTVSPRVPPPCCPCRQPNHTLHSTLVRTGAPRAGVQRLDTGCSSRAARSPWCHLFMCSPGLFPFMQARNRTQTFRISPGGRWHSGPTFYKAIVKEKKQEWAFGCQGPDTSWTAVASQRGLGQNHEQRRPLQTLLPHVHAQTP